MAIVGVFAKVKGADVLPALFAACRYLPVEWHLFGATEGAALGSVRRSSPRVVVHGAYRRARLAERLVAAGCHLVLLPSVGAETFSLTLSEVVAAGFPVIASHLGALGERVREQRAGWTFDPFLPDRFAMTLAGLIGDRAQIERVATHLRALPRRTEEDMSNDHAALWSELSLQPPRAPVDTASAVELFREGAARAARLHPSRLDALFAFLKKADFYRDLWVRRLVPENARRAVEAFLRHPTSVGQGRLRRPEPAPKEPS